MTKQQKEKDFVRCQAFVPNETYSTGVVFVPIANKIMITYYNNHNHYDKKRRYWIDKKIIKDYKDGDSSVDFSYIE